MRSLHFAKYSLCSMLFASAFFSSCFAVPEKPSPKYEQKISMETKRTLKLTYPLLRRIALYCAVLYYFGRVQPAILEQFKDAKTAKEVWYIEGIKELLKAYTGVLLIDTIKEDAKAIKTWFSATEECVEEVLA